MKLKCLASGSSGNCYLLENDKECLILDAGIPIKQIKQGLDWDINKVVGTLVTHQHKDHSKSVDDLNNMGIPILAPYKMKFIDDELPVKLQVRYGNLDITAFALTDKDGNFKHTNAGGSECPCYGFLITHPEMGRLLYITDTEFVKWKFKNINHILISCNYQNKYVGENAAKRNHVLRGHMELETVKEFIKANKSSSLENVILCHLSSENADPMECVGEIQKIAGIGVNVDYARAGLEVELNKELF